MNYADYRANLVSIIDGFLADMDAVHDNKDLTSPQKISAFADVAAKHQITLDEDITG